MSKQDKSNLIQNVPSKHDPALNIYQRMIEVQKLATTVQKTATVKMSENDKGYKATTHDEVAATLHLPLAQCGILMLPDIVKYETATFEKANQWGKVVTWYRTDLEILVKWVNVDRPEDFIVSRGAAFALDTSDKSFAKAYSLALKIVLLKVHLLESRDGEEDRPFDEANGGDKAGKGEPKQRPTPTKAQDAPPREEKPKDPVSPKDVIYPFESSIRGKKLGDVESATLEKAKDWLKSQMALDPKPKNMSQIALIYAQVKAVLIDRTPPPPDDIPENINASTGEFFPEDEVQGSPDVENQSQERGGKAPDPSDFVIPQTEGLDLGDLTGKRLGQISEKELRAAIKAIDSEMKKTPSNVKVSDLFDIRTKITTFFKSMDISL